MSLRALATLDYMRDHSEHLVVALLSEEAAALDDDYQRIEDI